MNPASFTCGITVLGCDKNTADAEHFAGLLEQYMGVDTCIACPEFPEQAMFPPLDALVIFTCAFISDAKEESIESILRWIFHQKTENEPERIYVAGCLSQRNAEELAEEIPEVYAWVGIDDLDRLCEIISENFYSDHQPLRPEKKYRKRLDCKPYAFLKIGDGCDHSCSFCIIPAIKGQLYSRTKESILEEAAELLASGVRELNLVAQDCTAYGRDLYEDYRLPQLLADLCKLPGKFWIRCLYCYPAGITDELLHQIATQPKIVPYLDIPLQHVSPRLLKAMRRPAHSMDIPAFIEYIREKVPGITLRTTMLIGFPGETDSDHKALISAVEKLSFEWLGAFLYSPEEGTEAATLENQVGAKTRLRRYNQLLETQVYITEAFNMNREDKILEVLVEDFDEERQCWTGRSASEAPEVDGLIFIRSKKELEIGSFIKVRPIRTELYDLVTKASDLDIEGKDDEA
ncbi:MAG: 30S ribosomal protein S12 methylthiotransferase RimO [Candidatus Hydrogenedens sp.]|jgi:ribosomal protein S12 methylthiotransferase|nr:30S ribosomal protein S12 methylthiotransferase RimO [Candidatus Hydrogenedens sp.]